MAIHLSMITTRAFGLCWLKKNVLWGSLSNESVLAQLESAWFPTTWLWVRFPQTAAIKIVREIASITGNIYLNQVIEYACISNFCVLTYGVRCRWEASQQDGWMKRICCEQKVWFGGKWVWCPRWQDYTSDHWIHIFTI